MSWPTEYARHLDVRTTSIYPLPKMSPDRALGDRAFDHLGVFGVRVRPGRHPGRRAVRRYGREETT
jgi:hypothetical protein